MRLGLSRFTAFSKFQSESSSLWQSQPSGRNITANLRNKTLSKPAVEAGVSPAILEFAVDMAASTGSVRQYIHWFVSGSAPRAGRHSHSKRTPEIPVDAKFLREFPGCPQCEGRDARSRHWHLRDTVARYRPRESNQNQEIA